MIHGKLGPRRRWLARRREEMIYRYILAYAIAGAAGSPHFESSAGACPLRCAPRDDIGLSRLSDKSLHRY